MKTEHSTAELDSVFRNLPLGAIKPRGWLQRQLRLQAEGLSGHLDEFWPSISRSRWIGGEEEGWERGPYWLDGLIPLAALLEDPRLRAKAKRWINYILEHQQPDGWLGEKHDSHEGEGQDTLDPWPLFVLFKALLQYYEAWGDERIPVALIKCASAIHRLVLEHPLRSWAKMRWADLSLSLHKLFELTGQSFLLDLCELIAKQGYDWNAHFADIPSKEKTRHDQLGPEVGLLVHGVNNAMGIKSGAVRWRETQATEDGMAPAKALEALDRYHGAPCGMFHADEHLAGLNPTQGFETCSVVEMMFSLETAGTILGHGVFFDRLESVAFNALAACCRSDMWAHQYHQQTNQIRCSVGPRNWTDAWHYANIFGQDTQFRCCQANLHQGWPKFAASLWLHSPSDNALVAVSYAPCTVDVLISGVSIRLEVETNYPFAESILIKADPATPVRFPLKLRIPSWAQDVEIEVNGDPAIANMESDYCTLEREWRQGDRVSLILPFRPRIQPRPNHAVSIWVGPLLMALPIQERWVSIPNAYEQLEPRAKDWEVHPESNWSYGVPSGGCLPNGVVFHAVIAGGNVFDNSETVPISLETKLIFIQNWLEEENSAGQVPERILAGAMETKRLLPYGFCRLRICEFPCVD